MFMNIAARAAAPAPTLRGNHLARNTRSTHFLTGPRYDASSFPDWRTLHTPAPRRTYFSGSLVASIAAQKAADGKSNEKAAGIKETLTGKREVYPFFAARFTKVTIPQAPEHSTRPTPMESRPQSSLQRMAGRSFEAC